MKTRILAFALAIVGLFAFTLASNEVNASPIKAPVIAFNKVTAYSIPVTGTNSFTGDFTITKFVKKSGAIYAVGTLTGTAVDPVTGLTQTISQVLTLPVSNLNGSCTILTLDIGAIHLNLLGLVVDIAPIHVNITGQQGTLLGGLLCSLANLLNGGGSLQSIVNLLNQILAQL